MAKDSDTKMDRIEQIVQRIDDCLTKLDRFHIFNPILDAADDLDENNPGIFERGKIDIWAASLIYAIVRHNLLQYDYYVNLITLEDICDFLQVNKKTISNKAGFITKMLDLQFTNPDYRVTRILNIEDDFEETENSRVHVHTVFKPFYKMDRAQKLQANELVVQTINKVNKNIDQKDHVELVELEIESKLMKIQLVGWQNHLDLIFQELQEHRMKLINISCESKKQNLYTPFWHYQSFMETFYSSELDSETELDDSEVDQMAQQFYNKSLDELKELIPISEDDEATITALEAFYLDEPESKHRANTILSTYPDCVEAIICLAGWESDDEKRIELLEDALDAGDRSLPVEEISKNKMWWTDYRTRPYMRAMLLLGMEFFDLGYDDDGTEILEELMEMDEADSQGARIILMEHYILKKKWYKANILFKNFPDDLSPTFLYGKVIHYYYSLGKKAKTEKALFRAFERNPHPMRLLVGLEEWPESTSVFYPGSPEEAKEVIDILSEYINQDTKFAKWIVETLIVSGTWVVDDEDRRPPIGDVREGGDAKIISLK